MKAVILILAAALAATAQTPVPIPFGECGVSDVGSAKASVLEPNNFSIPRGDLCEMYTFEAGWEKTMVLQLGEGAEEYRDLIDQAVKVWNEAVYIDDPSFGYGSGKVPLIEISDEQPSTYRVPRSFWNSPQRAESIGNRNLDDSDNVIYFTPATNSGRAPRGYTKLKTTRTGNRILEADVYINTDHVEEFGSNLALTQMIQSYAPPNIEGAARGVGAYAMIDAVYLVILHELGHAVGLKHIPVAGNVMNKDFMPGVVEQWAAPVALYLKNRRVHERLYDAVGITPHWVIIGYPEEMTRYMLYGTWARATVDLFTRTARLGAQEKMMLSCIYKY